MSYMHDYTSLDEVIGTTAETPYTGLVHGNKRVVFASRDKYGRHVMLVRDEKYNYFKPESYILVTTILTVSSKDNGGTIVVNEGMGVDCLYIYDNEYFLLRKSGNDFVSGETQYYAYDGKWFGVPYVYVSSDIVGDCVLNIYSKNDDGSLEDVFEYSPNCKIIRRRENEENFQQEISIKKGEKISYKIAGKILTIKEIGNDFELAENITYIEIPNTMSKIGIYTFNGCESLKEVKISDSVIDIGDYSFKRCSSLNNIILPENLETIGNSAFNSCSNLSSPTFPNSLKSIGRTAFEFCSSIKKIIIPDSVVSIGRGAFGYCTNLEIVNLSKNLTKINDSVFAKCTKISGITVPDSVIEIGNRDIHQTVNGAFSECINLKKIILSSKLQTIGGFAFSMCKSLEHITLPETVDYIGDYAFSDCEKLSNLKLPQTVTYIGEFAFTNCKSIEFLTIPKGLNSIANYSFSYCSSLSKVNIPNTIKKIGNSAFEGCSSLVSIIFDGTLDEWNSIDKGESWNFNMPQATIITCTEDGITLPV